MVTYAYRADAHPPVLSRGGLEPSLRDLRAARRTGRGRGRDAGPRPARIAQGTVTLHSPPGAGTTLVARLLLRETAAAETAATAGGPTRG